MLLLLPILTSLTKFSFGRIQAASDDCGLEPEVPVVRVSRRGGLAGWHLAITISGWTDNEAKVEEADDEVSSTYGSASAGLVVVRFS